MPDDHQDEFAALAAHIADSKSRLGGLHPTQLEQASGLGADEIAASLIASFAAAEAALSLLQELAEDLDRAGRQSDGTLSATAARRSG